MKIIRVVKLQIQAGKATSGPPLGPVLGQFKIPMMEFCKDFNDKTQHFNSHVHVTVVLFLYEDNSYSYMVQIPPISYFIKQLTQVLTLNGSSGSFLIDGSDVSKDKLHDSYAILSPQMIYELSYLYKQISQSKQNMRSIYRTFIASIHSMGLYIYSRKI